MLAAPWSLDFWEESSRQILLVEPEVERVSIVDGWMDAGEDEMNYQTDSSYFGAPMQASSRNEKQIPCEKTPCLLGSRLGRYVLFMPSPHAVHALTALVDPALTARRELYCAYGVLYLRSSWPN